MLSVHFHKNVSAQKAQEKQRGGWPTFAGLRFDRWFATSVGMTKAAMVGGLLAAFAIGFGSAALLVKINSSANSGSHSISRSGGTIDAMGVNVAALASQHLASEKIVELLRAETKAGVWHRTKEWTAILNSCSGPELKDVFGSGQDFILTPKQAGLRSLLFELWAQSEPRAAADFALKIPNQDIRMMALQTVVQAWLDSDSSAARAWITALPNGPTKALLAARLVEKDAQEDPVKALAETRKMPKTQRYGSLFSVFRQWASLDPKAAVQEFQKSGFSQMDASAALNGILDVWVASDPRAALSWTNTLAGRDALNGRMMLFAKWAASDPHEAIKYAKQIENLQERENALNNITSNWAQNDAKAALEFAASLNTRNNSFAIVSAASQLMTTDPDAALRVVKNLPPGPARTDALQQVAGVLAESDPERALELIRTLPAGISRDNALTRVVGTLSGSDPEMAELFAQALPPGRFQNEAYGQLASQLAWQSPEKAVAWAHKLPEGSARTAVAQQVAFQLVNTAPQKAIELADLAPPGQRLAILSAAMSQWISSDPTGAMSWADRVSDPLERAQILEGAVRGLAQTNPVQALELATSRIDNEEGRARALSSVGLMMASTDITSVNATIQRLPEGKKREAFIWGVANGLAQTSPTVALDYANMLPEGQSKSSVVSNVVQNWANSDPSAVVGWYASQSDTTKNQTLPGLVSSWANLDPAAAAQWLSQQPSGDAKDRGVLSMSWSGNESSIPTLAKMTEAIGNPQLREQGIQTLGTRWLQTDRAAAKAWLLRQNVSETTLRQLLGDSGN